MIFLKPQHWKLQWKASLSCFQRARAALARAVNNEEHLNEFWLAQSCFVAKWNFTLCWLEKWTDQYDRSVGQRKKSTLVLCSSVHFSHFITEKIQHLYSLILLFQATKALHKALSARQDLSFKGPRVQSTFSAPTERSLVKFGGLTEKRTKDQKALVHHA